MIFPWHFVQQLAHTVTSSTATLPLESAWICISTECTFYSFCWFDYYQHILSNRRSKDKMRHNDTTSGGQLVFLKINTPTPYYCCCIHNASTYIIYWKVTNVKLVLQLHFATWTTKISALFFWGVKGSNVYSQVKSCAITMTYCHGVQQRLSHRRKNLCSHLPLRYSCSALARVLSRHLLGGKLPPQTSQLPPKNFWPALIS